MKLSIPIALFLILINTFSAFGLGQKEELCQDLHPGVHLYKYHWDEEQCVFYVAEIDRKNSDLHLQVCIGQDKVLGKETVPSIAHRKSTDGKRTLVAINGGFGVLGNFGGLAGISHNLFVQDGELISGPIPEDVCFGVTKDGRFLMGRARMKAYVIFDSQKIPIEAINNRMRGDQRRDYNSILYTPRFGSSTHTRGRMYEAIMTGFQFPLIPNYQGNVVLKRVVRKGNRKIPPNGFVLSVRRRTYDDLLSQLPNGQQGKIEIRLEPDEWNDVVQAIGGNYVLVKDGKLSKFMREALLSDDDHKPGRRRSNKVISHEPRTALGFNDEKLFLIVVDGRQEGYSTGMTMYEVAQVLIELGAEQAMNLDGGASSTFYADGKVINRPSGGDLRKVLNAVLIVSDQ
ncbi:TPA: phosphodiester glycosidase family protein [Candidatus Poribacteria bacterium]|nr:phosphodiester glycosidase family protein [Candidatus Poribacteria bacterium]